MPEKPNREFGKRRPVAIPAAQPAVKRSSHVALLLMGTFAIGGGAYALVPGANCQPGGSGMAAPSLPQTGAECPPRGSSSSGGHGSFRRDVAAQQFLQRRGGGEPFFIGHGFRIRFRPCDAWRIRLVCAGVLGAFFRRRLTRDICAARCREMPLL